MFINIILQKLIPSLQFTFTYYQRVLLTFLHMILPKDTCLLDKICQQIYQIQKSNLKENSKKIVHQLIDEIDHLNMNLVTIDSYSNLQFIYQQFYKNSSTGKYLLSKVIQKLSHDHIPFKIKFIYLYSQQFQGQDRSQKLQNMIYDAFQLNLNFNKKLQVGYKCGLVYLQHIRQLQVFWSFLNKIIVYLKGQVEDAHTHYSGLRKSFGCIDYPINKKLVKKTLKNRIEDRKNQPKFNEKTKAQKLPFYQLLLKAYYIGYLKIKQQSKKYYYYDCLKKLQDKLLRDYPGKFMEQSFQKIKQKVKQNQYILKDYSINGIHQRSYSKSFLKQRSLQKSIDSCLKENINIFKQENLQKFRHKIKYQKQNIASHHYNCNQLSISQIKAKNIKNVHLLYRHQFINNTNSQQRVNNKSYLQINFKNSSNYQLSKKSNSDFRMRPFSKKNFNSENKMDQINSNINQIQNQKKQLLEQDFKQKQVYQLKNEQKQYILQPINQIKVEVKQNYTQTQMKDVKLQTDHNINQITLIAEDNDQKIKQSIQIQFKQDQQIIHQQKKWKNKNDIKMKVFENLELKIGFNLIFWNLISKKKIQNCIKQVQFIQKQKSVVNNQTQIKENNNSQYNLDQLVLENNQKNLKDTYRTFVNLNTYDKQFKKQINSIRISRTLRDLNQQNIQYKKLSYQLQQSLFNQRTQTQLQQQKDFNDEQQQQQQQIQQQEKQNLEDIQQKNRQIQIICSQMVDCIYDCICSKFQHNHQNNKQLKELKQSIKSDSISSIHQKQKQKTQQDLQNIKYQYQTQSILPNKNNLKLQFLSAKQVTKIQSNFNNQSQKLSQISRKKEKLQTQISILSKKSLVKSKQSKSKKNVKINKNLDEYEKDFIFINFSHYYQPKLQVSFQKIKITITQPISLYSQSKLFKFSKISRSSLIRKLQERTIKALNKAISLCSSNDLTQILENINIDDLQPKQIQIYTVIANTQNQKFKNIKFIYDTQNKKVYSQCSDSSLISVQIPIREDQFLEKIKDQLIKTQIKVCYQQSLLPYLVVFNLWCFIQKIEIVLKSKDKHQKKLTFILQQNCKIHIEQQDQDEDSNRNGQMIVHDMQIKIEEGHECLQFKSLNRKYRNKLIKHMSTVIGYYLQVKNSQFWFRQNTNGIIKILDII